MAHSPLVLGIDLGTQSTKVLVYEPVTRQILSLTSAPHRIHQAADGTSEQDVDTWLAAFDQCLQQTPAELRARVVALGVSGQQHGFVPLDQSGTPVHPVKLWNDTSTRAECEELTREFGGRERLIREVGNPILPGYTASKIRWLRNHHPERYRALAHILLPHDYLNFILTGQLFMEAGDASGTGLFDVRRRSWSNAMLSVLDPDRDLRACLPPLIASEASGGPITADIARRYGLPESARVASGGGDNMMAAIGTGCVEEGVFSVSLGTSGTVFAYSRTPVIDEAGVIAAFCSSTGGYLPLACTMNCTVASELTRKLFDVSVAELEPRARLAPRGAAGLITLPFYVGERTPNLPNARGCLLGASPQNMTPEHLLRSSIEGALFALRFGLDAFSGLGARPKAVRLTGGGAKSGLFRELAADIFDCPIECPRVEETAAFGAALQALWMLEQGGSAPKALAELVHEHVPSDGPLIPPNPEAVAEYAAVYRSYSEYVQLLTPKFV